MQAGRALRQRVGRRSHGAWTAARHREDPVTILTRGDAERTPALVPIRYGRMAQGPFEFFRGAAAIMAADLAHTPASGLHAQLCGDCHLANFGGFATPERNIAFDITDFDETLPGPWEWDLKRLATSVVVASRHNRFSRGDAREAARTSVRAYRERMAVLAAMGALDRWYQRIDVTALVNTVRTRKWRERVERLVARQASRSAFSDDFPKLADMTDGRPRIKDDPPLLFHETDVDPEAGLALVRAAVARYRETLAEDRRHLLDRYQVMDAAAKVVGVGSVGRRCLILLMMAAPDDVLFLQVKEARQSVLEPYLQPSTHAHHGERVVVGQRLMQSASDVFLGWTSERGRDYYVRQLRDIKIKPVVEVFDAVAMLRYAEWCGWALARAHARTGDAAAIAGYLGSSARVDEAIGRFAEAYADQNERDHEALLEAIRDGRVPMVQA
jgi:uncharacterized protein (DUF2252 family)